MWCHVVSVRSVKRESLAHPCAEEHAESRYVENLLQRRAASFGLHETEDCKIETVEDAKDATDAEDVGDVPVSPSEEAEVLEEVLALSEGSFGHPEAGDPH